MTVNGVETNAAAGEAIPAAGDQNAENAAGGEAGDGGIFEEPTRFDAEAFKEKDVLVFKDSDGNEVPLETKAIRDALAKQGLLKTKEPKFTMPKGNEDEQPAGGGKDQADPVTQLLLDKHFRSEFAEMQKKYPVAKFEQFKGRLGAMLSEAKATGAKFEITPEVIEKAAKSVHEENVKTLETLYTPYLKVKDGLVDNPAETGAGPGAPPPQKKKFLNIANLDDVSSAINNYFSRGGKR